MHRRIHLLIHKARRLLRDQRGGIAVFLAIALIPIVAILGIAVDSARLYFVQSRLSRAVDAAGLAGGHFFESDDDMKRAIDKYFAANFPLDTPGVTVDGPHITRIGTDAVQITANAVVENTLMRVVGQNTSTVAAGAVVRKDRKPLELVLVMDNTGSMRDGDKIGAMKAGARNLIDMIYGSRESVTDLWVGLIPFSATVNIGNTRKSWVTNLTTADFGNSSWKGCIEERVPRTELGETKPEARDLTDDPPSVLGWRVYLYPSDTDNKWEGMSAKELAKSEGQKINTNGNEGKGPNVGCPPPLAPLSASKTAVLNGIDAMGSWHRGGTMNHVGLVWAWRMLSPRWRGVWDGEMKTNLLPADKDKTDKAVVILTDGQNQFHGDDYTSYGRIKWGRIGYTTNASASDELDRRMKVVCDAMKKEGINLFTITFDVKKTEKTWTTFDQCASKPEQHFDAEDNEALRRTFQTIGDRLINLRLAQ